MPVGVADAIKAGNPGAGDGVRTSKRVAPTLAHPSALISFGFKLDGRSTGLSAEHDQGSVSLPPAQRITGLVIANLSLVVAVLVYMGWAYEDALYGYFHIRPLDLDVSSLEYILHSLSLFSPVIVVVAVLLTVIMAARTWDVSPGGYPARLGRRVKGRASGNDLLQRWTSTDSTGRLRVNRAVFIAAGLALTAIGLFLTWLARYASINTYVVLALLGGGPLLLTWPMQADRRGRFSFALAIVVAAVCALWAASLYAHDTGIGAAQNLVRGLPARTAVAVYSVGPLALSGPGVTVQRLPAGYLYHYRYEGLRLLITRSGTYYLLPVGWSPQLDITYVLDDSDQIRLELY